MDIGATRLTDPRLPQNVRAVEIGEPWPVGKLSDIQLRQVLGSIFNILVDEHLPELRDPQYVETLEDLFVEYALTAVSKSQASGGLAMVPSVGQLAGALDGIAFTVKMFQTFTPEDSEGLQQ